MAEELKYKCGKGILLSRDEDGNLVPFFVQVRDQDIITMNNNSISSAIVDQILEDNPLIPSSIYRNGAHRVFTYRGFEVETDNNTNIVKARKVFKIGRDFDFKDENNINEIITSEFTLPIALKVDGEFKIETTMLSANDSLKPATISGNFTQEIIQGVNYYVSGTISLVNMFYGFDIDFKDIDSYKESTLHVVITGELGEMV